MNFSTRNWTRFCCSFAFFICAMSIIQLYISHTSDVGLTHCTFATLLNYANMCQLSAIPAGGFSSRQSEDATYKRRRRKTEASRSIEIAIFHDRNIVNRGISIWTYRGSANRKLVDIRARVARRILLIIRAPIERIWAWASARHSALRNGRPF